MGKMKILLIQHSHTDIGYTDRQEKIEWHHIKYIERCIDILNSGRTDFKWTCESYWCVEKFLANADEKYKKDFLKYVKSGNIAVSRNYLNCTDLLDDGVLRETLSQNAEQLKSMGIDSKVSMTADINGYSWGYASALTDAGVEFLLSCVHTHHGQYATNKKQRPFFWQAPNGKKLLVWHGDHYHLGCEFGFNGLGRFSYMIRDGLANLPIDSFELSRRRIFRYIENMREEGYPFDFIPITVSGLTTDNSPPNESVFDAAHKWNELYGDEIEVVPATIDDLYESAKPYADKIEIFSGDWTDWWSDGVGSTPNVVKHYREAQRKYNLVKALDPEMKIADPDLMETARYNLMFYSEHTWGFSSSVSEPWHPQVNNLDMRKSMYAGIAHEAASRCLDMVSAAKGETPMVLNRDYSFHAINPNDYPIKTIARYDLETMFTHENFDVIDETTGEAVDYQHDNVARGHQANIIVELGAKEERRFYLREKDAPPAKTTGMTAEAGSEGIVDFEKEYNKDLKMKAAPYMLETPFFRISFEKELGITEVYDKKNNKNLLRGDREFNAFTPVYEVTPIEKNHCEDRRNMGRNRKAFRTERYAGSLKNVTVEACGEVFSRVVLNYELKGSQLCQLVLTGYRSLPRLDVDLRLNRDSVWEAENLYVTLPFTTGDGQTLWIDKLGAAIRPRIDQLPGSCIDFYCVQNGAMMTSDKSSLLIAMPDTPLCSMGTLKAHPIRLAGEDGTPNDDLLYSWVMNNFWETNFKVSLAGFHQYGYTLYLPDTNEPTEGMNILRGLNQGIMTFTSFDRPIGEIK